MPKTVVDAKACAIIRNGKFFPSEVDHGAPIGWFYIVKEGLPDDLSYLVQIVGGEIVRPSHTGRSKWRVQDELAVKIALQFRPLFYGDYTARIDAAEKYYENLHTLHSPAS